jgi:hypothetical protein
MYNKKYRLESFKEFNGHNSIYAIIMGGVCYLAYFNVGERGLFLCDTGDYSGIPHRIHTSIVKDVKYTRGNQVIVTTQNTELTFTLIDE